MSKQKRGRPSGPDKDKIELILRALAANPQGIWVRELARLTGIKRSTLSLYINTHLQDKIEDVHDKALPMRLICLKKEDQTPSYVG
ncbi:helix-turn-helix domain-containing protein [Candidatus Woesearchaeota archaeon]|nr:helix-turn-helix domain-containing protein [Candidatus Woesearchaeota archaeon]